MLQLLTIKYQKSEFWSGYLTKPSKSDIMKAQLSIANYNRQGKIAVGNQLTYKIFFIEKLFLLQGNSH